MTQNPYDDPQGSCPNCGFDPFIRNNYFRGKFLDVLDFTTEQRYFIDKLRFHHQRLHGWGVVCGLKVKEHSSPPSCQNKYLRIEPGSAVDCCGHEILLLEEEVIDFTQLPTVKALIDNQDNGYHRLQICLRYRECHTEPVPVLYDDCGCNENRCLPNRILESFEIAAVLDAKDPPPHLFTPKFKWDFSLNFAHASQVVLHDAAAPARLYVLTADAPGTIYQIDMSNHSVIFAYSLTAKGAAMAVSNDGSRLYVVLETTVSTDPRQLLVLDTTQSGGLKAINTSPIAIPNSVGSNIVSAVSPDNYLLTLNAKTGDLFAWPSDIDTNPTPTPPVTPVTTLGSVQNTFVIDNNGKFAYAANTNNLIQVTITGAVNTQNSPALPAGANISALTIINNVGTDIVYAADQTGKQILFWSTDNTSAPLSAITCDHPPFALKASADGQWLFVAEQETTVGYLQAIAAQGQHTAGVPYPIPASAQELALTQTGDRLYIPFPGDLTQTGAGGVAVVEVSEQNCCEIPWRQLAGCPACDTPDCLVLATIDNFHVGDSIQDQTDPPADPNADKLANIARIDNRKGRRLLPTPQVLLDLIECLKQQGTGKVGPQGPAGPIGLIGPMGPAGSAGAAGAGLQTGLTGVKAVSWVHNTEGNKWLNITLTNPKGKKQGIAIGFTGNIQVPKNAIGGIDSEYFLQVLTLNKSTVGQGGVQCRCAIVGQVIPITFNDNNVGLITDATQSDPNSANGVALILSKDQTGTLGSNPNLWVILRGDYVLDANGNAIDAEFVRAQLPTGNRLATNPALGIQGGTFESWFTIGQNQAP